GQQNAHWPLTF
nr:immunoglobulin light chain junction region [Macaca mulatta]